MLPRAGVRVWRCAGVKVDSVVLAKYAGRWMNAIPLTPRSETIFESAAAPVEFRDGLSGWQVEKGQDDDRDLKLTSAVPVMTWIHPGGHEYPDGTSERIAKFFRDHPLKP